MEIAIRHHIQGRVRLHVPEFPRSPELATMIVTWMSARAGVRSARANLACFCLVIEYDESFAHIFGMMLQEIRSATSGALMAQAGAAAGDPSTLLAVKTQNDVTTMSARKKGAHLTKGDVPPLLSFQSPLALPTLSLLLALSTNPVIAAINTPLMLWNAWPIAKRAWRVWNNEGRLNIDFLDTLAISASIAIGTPLAGTIVTWLIKLSDWIRDLTAAGSRRAIVELMEFQTKTAWIIRDGEITSIPTSELAVGDLVVVYPGEIIPVDGEIVDGHATIDQKTITGEGLPVNRGKGETAFAATVIREGRVTVLAARVGLDTTAGQIAHLVDSAPIGDTRMQNHAELLADQLVMPTLGLATGAAVFTGDFNRFLSLVIVDYGTGIRVAAPTSVLSSMTHAARAGIVIKSGGHMEKLAHADTIIFDKTGTLTHGVPEVVDIRSYLKTMSPESLLGPATAAETRLHHPVAEALRTKAIELAVAIPPCDDTEYKVGLGVQGQVNGFYLHVGSERFMRQNNIRVTKAASHRSSLDEHGHSSLYIAVDGKLGGVVGYSDKIRPESRDVITRLRSMGFRNAIMLTGDNSVVAKAVSARLGLTSVHAEMMPADKATIVQELQQRGNVVAMVGDGINDSPALSYADIGIAMRFGAEITHESADVVLMEDSLWKLVKAVEISRRAVSLIKQNYAIVVGLNTLALGLALPGGLISPTATAILSNGSAILATLNGIRPVLRYQ